MQGEKNESVENLLLKDSSKFYQNSRLLSNNTAKEFTKYRKQNRKYRITKHGQHFTKVEKMDKKYRQKIRT